MQKTLLHNLLYILRRYRPAFLKSLLMLIISNGLLIANPLLFRQAVMAMDPTESLTATSWLHRFLGSSLVSWALLLIAVAATSAFFKYWMRIGFITISRNVEKEIRDKLFVRIQSQSRAFFDRHGIGELLSRLTNDISLYRDLLGPGSMYPLFFFTIVIPGIIALFTISVPLACLSMIPLLIIPILHATLRHQNFRLSHEVQVVLGSMTNMVQEHFSGIRILKSYAIENAATAQFSHLCRDFASLNFKMTFFQGVLFPLVTLITKITTILLVLLSGYIILKAWGELSTADFVSFMWIQSYIFFPVLMLGWVMPIYERGRAAYSRLVEVYFEPIEVQDNPSSSLRIPPQANIICKNLTFCYPNTSRPVLNHFNLDIKGGSFVGITGPVGAGKTSLLYLLNREYEIPHNMLFIGGHEIHDYPLRSFRAEMITVEQASFLFSRTVAENVRFGRSEATQEELELVSRYADLHDTVMEFPEQYETVVGERGVTLSGGQRQRVAIARAFLVNRSILLLDDIFSAVDSETEKRIFTSIRNHFSGRTIILITHRVSILEKMDRVIYMMQGHVEEDGTPEELRAKKGHYSALVELQNLSQE